MDTNGKQIVTDKVFTDCTLYCVHYVSLPHKTELAKYKRTELPPFLIVVSILTKEINSISKLFVYFFMNKN